MSISNRHKEKHRMRSEVSREDFDEGTAARTRPFSFDDIMLRRKEKKQSADGYEDAENKSVKNVRRISGHSESERSHRNHANSLPAVVKSTSENIVKVNDRKKEDSKYISEDKIVKGKEKENHVSGTRSKTTLKKDVDQKVRGGKDDRRGHIRRKRKERLGGDPEYESGKRTRDLAPKDGFVDRSRGSPEEESKTKYRNYDDDRGKEKNSVRKRDMERHTSELLERKERKESPELQRKESGPKRRRSRSREHYKDRGRRSPSFSPRTHKHLPYSLREHGDMSSRTSRKDRSGKQQSDVDRIRISSNGSSTHHHRHGSSASGLGGYSPRKRRTKTAVKTPSPTRRSPEKKSAGWDLPPPGTEISMTGSVPSNMQPSNQVVTSNIVASITSTAVKALTGVTSNAAIDSIQLTQATRPMRRLYVENLPASASEKSLRECFNNFLLSGGVNHIQGTQPCINCIVNKEKDQALVEFLTPEDASAALSFDGRSFSGSILKIRRPKDFVEVATGVTEISADAVDSISNAVKDSPYKCIRVVIIYSLRSHALLLFAKYSFAPFSEDSINALLQIFVGGIPNAISSEMLMELAGAFGPLKAYHFEINAELNEPFAFLEYVDQSITLKACAGLNGMKLGAQALTAVQATPDASPLEDVSFPPFYGIPEHAKPLLEKPTQVLKLQNVMDPDCLSSLSEPELDEILEDLRLECSRFGTVKSVNIVRCSDSKTAAEICITSDDPHSAGNAQEDFSDVKRESSWERIYPDVEKISIKELANTINESEVVKVVEANNSPGEKIADDHKDDASNESAPPDKKLLPDENRTVKDLPNSMSLEPLDELDSANVETENHDDKSNNLMQSTNALMEDNVDATVWTVNVLIENDSLVEEHLKSVEAHRNCPEASAEMSLTQRMESNAFEGNGNGELACDLKDIFEPGCVLVEYRREEAACMAAHCLHRRLFDDRIVTVAYIQPDVYQARFPK